MTWYYLGDEFIEADIGDNKAFVYLICNQVDGRSYVGKKKFFFVRRRRKAKQGRKHTLRRSDWEIYYGSSKELSEDVVRLGPKKFTRNILHLCKTFAEASYLEIKEQLARDVLLKPDQYYNCYVGCRIHRSHVIGMVGNSRSSPRR